VLTYFLYFKNENSQNFSNKRKLENLFFQVACVVDDSKLLKEYLIKKLEKTIEFFLEKPIDKNAAKSLNRILEDEQNESEIKGLFVLF
jgi:hypothetical protein